MRTKKIKNMFGWIKYLPMLVMLLIGAAYGIYITQSIERMEAAGESSSMILLSISGLFMGLYLALISQIILHEAGHLLFGLMTGYHFSSFRIGSFMWINDGRTIRLCKLKIAGTGGQCLMVPPELQDGKIPYVLYNMGGSITNFLSAVFFLGIALLTKNVNFLSTFFMMIAVIGTAFAFINGIPMRLGIINNDGYNAVSLGKDPEALRSFWIQLKSSELSLKGMRIKDMPDEWFEIPSPETMKNSINVGLCVLACSRMMDQLEFEKARCTMQELLQSETGIVGLQSSLLITDLIYCELVGENRPENLTEMLDKKQKKFIKTMKNYLSVQRTEYAYALLSQKDTVKAEQIKVAFEKTAKNYPHKGSIEFERELMAYAESRCIAI